MFNHREIRLTLTRGTSDFIISHLRLILMFYFSFLANYILFHIEVKQSNSNTVLLETACTNLRKPSRLKSLKRGDYIDTNHECGHKSIY